MEGRENVWVIVLAAGDGKRLRSLTTDAQGITIPKQFCSFKSPRSMLSHAMERAGRVVANDRIVPIVAAQHEQWWVSELEGLPTQNIVVQPQNRGTAIGILLPLMHIYRQDRSARIIILPSDHHVADESVMTKSLSDVVTSLDQDSDRVVLLGITADAADTEYGWIVPKHGVVDNLQRVDSFVEKPPQPVAEELLRRGALWNSFILAASAPALIGFYERTYPELLHDFNMNPNEDLEELYESLPHVDFSHDILERNSDHLWVLPVPACGWSDLGTPEKIVCLLKSA